jgi:Rrf2 family cysteine metabolism transcriptional repressor
MSDRQRQESSTVRTIPQISGALHFSTRGEYGVRLMVELARHRGTGPVSLADISDHEDLPRPYLEQLVISLREAGLVVSTRGARGGYELSRDPRNIRMSQVVEALEGPISPMVCATDHGSQALEHPQACDRTSFCNVQSLWIAVREAVMGALDSMTLADLAGPHPAHPFHSLPIHASTLPVAERPAITESVPHA